MTQQTPEARAYRDRKRAEKENALENPAPTKASLAQKARRARERAARDTETQRDAPPTTATGAPLEASHVFQPSDPSCDTAGPCRVQEEASLTKTCWPPRHQQTQLRMGTGQPHARTLKTQQFLSTDHLPLHSLRANRMACKNGKEGRIVQDEGEPRMVEDAEEVGVVGDEGEEVIVDKQHGIHHLIQKNPCQFSAVVKLPVDMHCSWQAAVNTEIRNPATLLAA
ncbi:hypothetical protein C8R44DRAFT_890511 [Mycena epipterygia]|nr:hypothetical protein C8R44DRAFT_890511 [Mycena epipterygia]